jgi:hypothetical protein
MLKQKVVYLHAAIAIALILGACSAPLFEIRDNPIETGAEGSVTLDQVGSAIMDAGKGLGWKMVMTRQGEIAANYSSAKQSATVAIPYSTNTYSILYKNSTNFKYNGTKIHKRYNELISGFDAAIRRELSRLTKVPQPARQEEPTTMGKLTNWLRSLGSDEQKEVKPAGNQ